MEVLDAIKLVQAAAEKKAAGDQAAHFELLMEIHKLRLITETPNDTLMRLRFQPLQNLSIRLALEYGLLQHIVKQKGNQVTAEELSQETGVDELLIRRIMRVVTFAGMCKEVGYATYASNENTEAITVPGNIGAEKHHTDLGFKVGAELVELKRQNRLFQFPEGPDQKSPFEYTFGAPLFGFFEQNAEHKESFDTYMAMRRPDLMPQWFDIYPTQERLSQNLKQDNDAALIVDVGGGRGRELTKFSEKFPDIPGRLILQDLKSTLDGVPTDLGKVEPMAIDFFINQPVQGARIYYLRQVLHDWSDERCKVILSHIVKAMDPGYSRLILDEFVLQNTDVDGVSAGLDLLMMMYVSGVERTEKHWGSLLESVGLEIVNIWPAKNGREAIIEAVVKQ